MSEVRTYHDEFMKKARVVFSRAGEGYDTLRDDQRMFCVEEAPHAKDKPPVFYARSFGIVTNDLDTLLGNKLLAPYQDVELYQQRSADERADSERLKVNVSSPVLALFSNGDYSLHLPAISGIGSIFIRRDGKDLGLATEFGQDMTLSATYHGIKGSETRLSNFSLHANTEWLRDIPNSSFTVGFSSIDEKYGKDSYRGRQKIDKDKVYTYHMYGRRVELVLSDDNFKFLFHELNGKDPDFVLDIPLFQKMERIIDHKGEDADRYLWEDDVLAETLRKDPSQPYSEIADEKWLRADIKKLLGIKLLKSNPAPKEEEKED